MHKLAASIRDKKGAAALIAVYMVLMVLSIFTAAFLSRSIYQNRAVMFFKKYTQAFNLAESGLDRALNWLRAQASPPIGNYTDPWGGVQSLGAGIYSAVITDLGAPGVVPGIRRYRVTSTGTVESVSRVLTSYIQTDNYARYIWFTDREDYDGTNVWFWTQDTLNGPTQTNGHFNIAGDPTFNGEVGSVDDYIRFFNNGNNVNLGETSNPPYDNPNFLGGMTFGSEQCNMPSQALNLRTASTNGGLRLQGDTTVVLNANSTMNVTNSIKGWTNKNMALPANGALFVDSDNRGRGGSLTISGTLSGRLTAGCKRDLVIPTNLIYAVDPRINPASTDTLGLISEEDVVISHSAPTNMEIDGAVMSLHTSFMLADWWEGPAKGTLTVFGGIIQDERGPVGTFNGQTGQKISGYSKSYSYDARLLSNPPPFFPTTGDYITLSWED
jgi:hypothetical protein